MCTQLSWPCIAVCVCVYVCCRMWWSDWLSRRGTCGHLVWSRDLLPPSYRLPCHVTLPTAVFDVVRHVLAIYHLPCHVTPPSIVVHVVRHVSASYHLPCHVTHRWSVLRWRHQIVFTVRRHTVCEVDVCGCGSLKFQSTFIPWPQLFSQSTDIRWVCWITSPQSRRLSASS